MLAAVVGEFHLHLFEHVARHDRVMLAVMDLVTIHDLAKIEPVLQQMVERAEPDPRPTDLTTALGRTPLGPDTRGVQFLCQRRDRSQGKIALVYDGLLL